MTVAVIHPSRRSNLAALNEAYRRAVARKRLRIALGAGGIFRGPAGVARSAAR